MSLRKILSDLSEVIFPPQCLGCAEILPSPSSSEIFCTDCLEKINFISGSFCPICGASFPDSPAPSHLCGDCLDHRPHFSAARSIFSYEGVILNVIHRFKYKNNLSVGEILASFMAGFSFSNFDFQDYSLILPVPLHVRRLRERGFNQSLILSRAIGRRKQIPVSFSVLKRNKFTPSQAGSNKKERKDNIKGAFEVYQKEKIAGKNVILVDDVYTTGATINECAKTLMKAGAKKVSALTLARVRQN